MNNKKILVALSGGVDSAVAAYLLKKAGYCVHGVFFRSWQNETELWKECPWKEDLSSAKSAAEHLEIPFEVVNFIEFYRKKVVDYLINGYKVGETPNPDVMCNRYIKFGTLIDYANDNDFQLLATGHYCRKIGTKIYEGLDKNKDQSYFLCLVKKENFANVCFPLGEISKQKVREIANNIKLPNANRKDSQGICFLGSKKVNINSFLDKYLQSNKGNIVTVDNKIIGQHNGLFHFTIGQRKGINIPSNADFEHYVVVGKDYSTNNLIVGFDKETTEGLYTDFIKIGSLNFLEQIPMNTDSLLVKPRYRDPSQTVCYQQKNNTADLYFKIPQRAIALGQAVAIYKGDQLIGGGIVIANKQ